MLKLLILKVLKKASFILTLLVLPHIGLGQFCESGIFPPDTVNGIRVTESFQGGVNRIDRGPSRQYCGLYQIPNFNTVVGVKTPRLGGGTGEFTYNLYFSLPVNNVRFVVGDGGFDEEDTLSFKTNAGIPAIIDSGSCYLFTNGNLITSRDRSSKDGGGYFTLSNPNPFTQLTVCGPKQINFLGGQAIVFCSTSFEAQIYESEEICSGDSVQIGGIYRKEAGLYRDTIIGGKINGGDTIVYTQLSVVPLDVDLGQDTSICKGGLLLNAENPAATYLWQDGSSEPKISATQTGTYWVRVNLKNCIKSDTIRLTVEGDSCKAQLELPNVFTPNGDGINDFFRPIKMNNIESMKFKIYNRWGTLVFETTKPLVNWNARDVPSGVYYWTISYVNQSGEEFQENGEVTVLK